MGRINANGIRWMKTKGPGPGWQHSLLHTHLSLLKRILDTWDNSWKGQVYVPNGWVVHGVHQTFKCSTRVTRKRIKLQCRMCIMEAVAQCLGVWLPGCQPPLVRVRPAICLPTCHLPRWIKTEDELGTKLKSAGLRIRGYGERQTTREREQM